MRHVGLPIYWRQPVQSPPHLHRDWGSPLPLSTRAGIGAHRLPHLHRDEQLLLFLHRAMCIKFALEPRTTKGIERYLSIPLYNAPAGLAYKAFPLPQSD